MSCRTSARPEGRQRHRDGRLDGFSRCNHLSAEYRPGDDAISVGLVAATRMVCVDSVITREPAPAAGQENARS